MKFFHTVPYRRRRSLFFIAMWAAATMSGYAQTLSWSNPLGSVTIFGSGTRVTTLESMATLEDVTISDSLNFLDAASLPAVSRSEAAKDAASFITTTQLSVSESQTSGLPVTSGSIDFTSTGGDAGSGFGTITLYFLINVPSPAMIDLSGIRSSITTTGVPASLFSLDLFQSDASGGRFGDAVLSYAGSYFDASGSYQTSQSYYLLEMNVAANATPASADAVNFSFFLDLAPVVAVPEPSSTALLMGAVIAGLAVKKSRRRRISSRARKP